MKVNGAPQASPIASAHHVQTADLRHELADALHPAPAAGKHADQHGEAIWTQKPKVFHRSTSELS